MKKGLLYGLCIVLMIISGCGKQTPSPDISVSDQQIVTKKIYALGDSLTAGYRLDIEQGYPAQLEKILRNSGYMYQVINGGKSGDTSDDLKRRLAWTTADAQTGDIAIIVIGANDAFRGEQIEILKTNLQEIVSYLQSRGMKIVIGGMEITTNYSQEYRDAFRQVYADVAAQYGSDLIPFFLASVATKPELNLPDGIHPNASGYVLLAQNVYDALVQFNLLQ